MESGTHYDAHIPLLWYGWGIRQGKLNREVTMTDIAPTVAALLHIQMPSGMSDGDSGSDEIARQTIPSCDTIRIKKIRNSPISTAYEQTPVSSPRCPVADRFSHHRSGENTPEPLFHRRRSDYHGSFHRHEKTGNREKADDYQPATVTMAFPDSTKATAVMRLTARGQFRRENCLSLPSNSTSMTPPPLAALKN